MVLLSRRQFGQAALGAAAAAGLPSLSLADDVRRLVAQPGLASLVSADTPKTEIWGYDGAVPGPLLRYP